MRGPCWTLNCATEGIGRTYPQHQTMGPGYAYDAPNSVHKLPFDSLPDFDPNFDTIIIHGHAKLTDLLSTAPIRHTGYLVSSRLRGLFEEFKLPLHRFYPVPATHRGKPVNDYFWLQLPGLRLPLTDDSTIEELEAAINTESKFASLDLLRIHEPTQFAYCFVSDPLRRAMDSAKITGVRFGTAKLFRSVGNT